MTLGIEAGSKAVLVTTDLDDEEAGDVWIMAPDYPERLDGYPEGIYTFEGETTLIDVGPASIYNEWRELLSKLALEVKPETI